MTVWEPGMGHAACVAARERHGMIDGTFYEIPDTDRGRWRQRQLYREIFRAMLHTGERLLDVEWAFSRPIIDSSQTRLDPMVVRNMAKMWGLTL